MISRRSNARKSAGVARLWEGAESRFRVQQAVCSEEVGRAAFSGVEANARSTRVTGQEILQCFSAVAQKFNDFQAHIGAVFAETV